MGITTHWNPGEPVVLRGVWNHRLWWALPVTVVQDTPNLIVLYWPAGTPNKLPLNKLTPQDVLAVDEVHLVDGEWVDTDVLMLVIPGAAHAVYTMWDAGGASFRCWYVNLQDPLQRTDIGFDTRDHLLDIVICPDLSEWWWKDEDEFEDAVKVGLYTAEQAHAIRAEGERVIQEMLSGQSPFSDGWERWSPPEDWEIPQLTGGWDVIFAKEHQNE